MDNNNETNINISTVLFHKLNPYFTIRERKEYTQHYNEVLKYFVNEMKNKCKLFKKMYKGTDLGGSYADRLKVSKPNEFDTVILLQITKNESNITIEKDEHKHAYVHLKLNKNCDKFKCYRERLNKIIDKDCYLLQDKTLNWIKSIIMDILRDLNNNKTNDEIASELEKLNVNEKKKYCLRIKEHFYILEFTESGPALTLKIKVHQSHIEFDMDLVPAYPFSGIHWLATRNKPSHITNITWHAVPKPSKKDSNQNNKSFISSYVILERNILKNRGNLKVLIRIFKKIRDINNWTNLKSYYIKTVFLHQIDEKNHIPDYWTQSLSILFNDMFMKIFYHIKERKLLFYWNSDYNMFACLQNNQLMSIQESMSGIRKKLINDPNFLIDILLTKEEQDKYVRENPNLILGMSESYLDLESYDKVEELNKDNSTLSNKIHDNQKNIFLQSSNILKSIKK